MLSLLLFHVRRRHLGAASSAGSGRPVDPLPPQVLSVEVHRVWLLFFEEQFKVCRNRSAEDMAYVAQAVASALSDARRLSLDPASFGTRVRLLHLAMNVLHAAHYPFHTHAAAAARFASTVASSLTATPLSPAPRPDDATSPIEGFAETIEDPSRLFDTRSAPPRGPTVIGGGMDALQGALPNLGGAVTVGPGEAGELGAPLKSSSSLLSASKYSVALSGGLVEVPFPGQGQDEDLGAVEQEPGRPGSAPCTHPLFKAVAVDAWVTLTLGSLAVFREHIFRAALGWFAARPSWYECATSAQRVREDFNYVTGMGLLLGPCAHAGPAPVAPHADVWNAPLVDTFGFVPQPVTILPPPLTATTTTIINRLSPGFCHLLRVDQRFWHTSGVSSSGEAGAGTIGRPDGASGSAVFSSQVYLGSNTPSLGGGTPGLSVQSSHSVSRFQRLRHPTALPALPSQGPKVQGSSLPRPITSASTQVPTSSSHRPTPTAKYTHLPVFLWLRLAKRRGVCVGTS